MGVDRELLRYSTYIISCYGPFLDNASKFAKLYHSKIELASVQKVAEAFEMVRGERGCSFAIDLWKNFEKTH